MAFFPCSLFLFLFFSSLKSPNLFFCECVSQCITSDAINIGKISRNVGELKKEKRKDRDMQISGQRSERNGKKGRRKGGKEIRRKKKKKNK